jgi:aspartate 1-decarboxylase
MLREVLQGKIHNATITEANVEYIGSIAVDPLLLEKADLWPGQKVLVVSNTSGARLETYIIVGEPGSGKVTMNGAAAHLIRSGEQVIIIGFCLSDRPIEPKCVLVDEKNRFLRYL